MAPLTSLLPLPLLLLATLCPTPSMCYATPAAASIHQDPTKASSFRTYIVLVEPPPSNADEDMHRRWYESFLPSLLIDDSDEPRLVHSYIEVFSGFAAKLTVAELDAVSKKPGFVRAFPSRTLQLMTTHTPEFLGLRKGTGFWGDANYGKGVIIGLLDTGIYAAHPSFEDHGILPPPKKWKGLCQPPLRCNNKLIGAKTFIGGDSSDTVGHGTHTSSTVAGNFVTNASYRGLGTGTAAGIAPSAHIAMYKVCTPSGCEDSDIVAGMDAAIKDGVDVLSLSLGGLYDALDEDPVAIGAYSAVSKNIIVVGCAGNDGPILGWVTNDAPWVLTVAAGSVDRSFSAGVLLGNGKHIDGEALTQVAKPDLKSYPIFYSDIGPHHFCDDLDDGSAAGKIVVCQSLSSLIQDSKIHSIMASGAVGVVLFNSEQHGGYSISLRDYNSRVVQVSAADGFILRDYAMSGGSSAVATFTYNNTLLNVRPAPVVEWDSSRGPSHNVPGVLKPDILAPGLNILAAWPPNTASVPGHFNIMSGTSAATPHVSGVVALIKSMHPDWSPAAIKSAILTTSDDVDLTGGPILNEKHQIAGVYARGAGHVNPAKAANPGLVYDLGISDYASFICWLLGKDGLVTISRNSSLTCEAVHSVRDSQLNYPTITVPLTNTVFTVSRTVTNVGPAVSTYKAKVETPKPMSVRVTPDMLEFTKTGEKKTFTVSVHCPNISERYRLVEGRFSWVSEEHVVRSPIVALRETHDRSYLGVA